MIVDRWSGGFGVTLIAAVVAGAAQAQPAGWVGIGSEGVGVDLSAGSTASAVRAEIDFAGGAGYAIVRLDEPMRLPENYVLSFDYRADVELNTLEVKLVGPDDRDGPLVDTGGGEDVWWVNLPNHRYPTEWTSFERKRRHFTYAWGPGGAESTLDEISAIEIAVVAGRGGDGWIEIDNLRVTEIEPDRPYTGTPSVVASAGNVSGSIGRAYPPEAALAWTGGGAGDVLTVDFGEPREFAGVTVDWIAPTAFVLEAKGRDGAWRTLREVSDARVERSAMFLGETEASAIRVRAEGSSGPIGTRAIAVHDLDFARHVNGFLEVLAAHDERGAWPKMFLGEMTNWTAAGDPDSDFEVLVSELGEVELYKAGPRLEPVVLVDDRALTWADASVETGLIGGHLPIPWVEWTLPGHTLRTEVCAIGDEAIVRYTLTNTGGTRSEGSLSLALRPFQVLPQWQFLNTIGGRSWVESLAIDADGASVNGARRVHALTPADTGGGVAFDAGEVMHALREGANGLSPTVSDAQGLASGAMLFGFDLAPGASREVAVVVRLDDELPRGWDAFEWSGSAGEALARAEAQWRDLLGRVGLELPGEMGAEIVRTYLAQIGYILVNRDGPSIQPGSRTYERSWIRDGSVTSTAMHFAGYSQAGVDFVDWYAPYQFESGKIPCVVDFRGADPVPEHDSHGQYIYTVWKAYKMTGDRSLLDRHAHRVERAVDYIASLVAQRSTDDYRSADGIKGACFGLVPESISHEGYAEHPMHSYWDGFWVIRGLADAERLFDEIGDIEQAERAGMMLAAYREAVYTSIEKSRAIHGIDYIPGCVELGDYDPTSTAIAVFPCGELEHLPAEALRATFDRYMEFFRTRRDGTREWRDYTPYEVRIIAALVLMGREAEAGELIEFFMADRFPAGFAHWAEVVHNPASAPRFIGDMPHTWVGSGFVNSIRTMLVHEDEAAEVLWIARGVQPEWAEGGLAIRDFPTLYGRLSYSLRTEGDATTIELAGDVELPAGGLRFLPWWTSPVRSASVDGAAAEIAGDGSVVVRSLPASLIVRH